MSKLNLRKRNVALYVRCATKCMDGRRDGITHQQKELQKYANKKGASVLHVYIDDGISGTSPDRPALAELLGDAREGKVDTLLVTSEDRLSRSYPLLQAMRHDFEEADVTIIALNRNVPTPEEKFMRAMYNIFREFERSQMSERIRHSLSERRKKFGYVRRIDRDQYRRGQE